jgi:hypothetical protein
LYDEEQNDSLSYKELVGSIFGNNSLAKDPRPESRQQPQQNQRKSGHNENSRFSFIEREE